ncbi:MAG: bifunctional riboflavin kinase/FAD synthetase, partial [Bacteroidaceae bacterium]|nr:bifunctional riboflavin kinase/FAD synthetase [Bacteroidaceae bacterium]
MQIINDTSSIVSKPCVATIGSFDGVHAGHCFLIQQVKKIAAARNLSSSLVTFPIHPLQVLQKSSPKLLTTPEEKLQLLGNTNVDYCFLLDFTLDIAQLSAREFMSRILKEQYNVQCLVIGYDHRFGYNRSEGFEDYCRYGSEMGIDVIRAKEYSSGKVHLSSSLIRESLLHGQVEQAAVCLGYEYKLEGAVVGGFQVGRTIGFPTANIKVDNPDKLIPEAGVYAVRVFIEGCSYHGMLYIGYRPTLHNGVNESIEVNIFDFHADIYNCNIRISFVHYVRCDMNFANVDELALQLHKDEK